MFVENFILFQEISLPCKEFQLVAEKFHLFSALLKSRYGYAFWRLQWGVECASKGENPGVLAVQICSTPYAPDKVHNEALWNKGITV
jgi:hypothetical protein